MNIIEDTLNEIKKSTDYQVNKRTLREKITNDLHIIHSGGLFLVNMELIAFLSIMTDEDIIIQDVYGNPVKVNRASILNDAIEKYRSITNAWHQEHEALRQIRKI